MAEGHDQFVDDMFTTHNGKYLAVSRPSLSDVVWIDLAKAVAGKPDSIVAEAQLDGFRTDHMGVSPDGRRLLVSDSTERQVIEYSMVNETLDNGTKVRMGQRLRTFASGDTPHENNYSANGKRIFHASIGRVYTPGDYGYLGPVDAEHDPRRGEGGPLAAGRAQPRLQGGQALGHGARAGGGRLPGVQQRRTAGGTLARRTLHVRAGVVPSRLRRVRPEGRPTRRAEATTSSAG